MKINHLIPSIAQETKEVLKENRVLKKQTATNKNVLTKSPLRNQENVRISQQARQLQRLKQNITQLSPIRQQKVAQVKKAINQGNYQVNAKATAAKLLKHSLINSVYNK